MTSTHPNEDTMEETKLPTAAGASIQDIAKACHEANRAYCQSIGDDSQVAWDDAPEWQKESAIAGVRAIAEGKITTPGQTHEAWLTQKSADGWKYGPVKDAEAKTHPCFLPYGSLPEEQRKKDEIFLATAAAGLGLTIVDGVIQLAVHTPEHEEPSGDGETHSEAREPITAADVAKGLEEAPDHVEIPESAIPVGMEIVKEAAERWTFKVPGKPWVNGKGRTIAGAMLDAGLIR